MSAQPAGRRPTSVKLAARRTSRAAACLALVAAAAACRPGGERPAGADAGAASAQQPPPGPPGLTLDLTPRPDRGDLVVEVRVDAPIARAVRELHVSLAWADTRGAEAVSDLDVRDARGPLPLGRARDEDRERVFPLDRPPDGDLVLRYLGRGGPSRIGLRVARDRLTGIGHGFLLLPRLAAPAPARVRWHTDPLGPAARAAASFGEGDLEATLTTADLAHAVYTAGPLQATGDPTRRLVALNAPALNHQEILDWAIRVRALAALRLGVPPLPPGAAPPSFTVFLLGEPGMGKDHDGAFLGRAVSLWFDAARPFDPQLRIALAHELVHRHLGAALQVLDDAGRPAPWLSEGFTVHYARRILFDAGLITPEDFVEDLDRIEDEAADPLASSHSLDRAAYRRGSHYAALLDATIRRASRGSRSLDDFIKTLPRTPIPVADFRAAIERDMGPKISAELDAFLRGDPMEIPSNAYGPCFRRRTARRPVFDLGFDPRSLDATPPLIQGVTPGTPAHRAGLRNGALLLHKAKIPRPSDPPTAEVDLTISSPRGGKRVRYNPSTSREITRWTVRPCTR